jgi:hypothetical protein
MTTKTKLVAALFIIVATLSITIANAQSVGDGKLRFGIGVDGLLPVGSLNNLEGFGLGITPRLQYGISNNVALTFTSGIYHFFPKQYYVNYAKYDLDIIPVKAGIKVFVTNNIYLAGEAGAGFEVENGGGPVKLILSPGLGYASKHWDIGARYENFSGNDYAYGTVGLRVAYGFGL